MNKKLARYYYDILEHKLKDKPWFFGRKKYQQEIKHLNNMIIKHLG